MTTATEQPRRRWLKGGVEGRLLTGNRIKAAPACIGNLIEREPGGPWLFASDPAGAEIIAEHNRLAEKLWQEHDRQHRNRNQPQPANREVTK